DEIKKALRSVAGFPERQIQVVTGENATREGITEALTAVVERARTQANARFLFYLKGRSLRAQGKNYFLPYDARVGAISTYIEETTLANWFDRVPLRMKALIQATWATDDQGDQAFSSQLAEILRDEGVDGDRDRKVTLAEMGTKIRELGFRGDYPIHITGDGAMVLVRLLSALEVTSQPPGATILLDDTEKGVTPARLVGLTPGTHRLRVKKDLYRMPEEQTVEIAAARGQRVISPSYQLTPISVYGTALDVDKKIVDGAEVHIVGTEYRQSIDNEGKFSFENWQAYGLLASGKTYEMVAQSPDGLYGGSASFTFSGTEDIRLVISLTQTNWIGLAAQRLAGGDRAGAVALFDAKLQTSGQGQDKLLGDKTLNDITPALALDFLAHLESKLQTEPDNLQWRVAAAQLADLNGDTSAARSHWKTVKANASKETGEYKQAVARLKETAPIGLGGILALTVVGVGVLGAAGLYVRNRRRIGEFREIPNPYIAGKPITEQDMFFGREDVFDFIKDKFSRAAKDITIVLHGGRRTGKTSVLYQIANGRLGGDFVPVLIDMQEMAGVDAHDFFRIIAQKISEVYKAAVAMSEADRTRLDELCRSLEDKTRSEYQSFNDFLGHAAAALGDKYLIFLIDEYEILERKVNEGDLTAEIFTYLRHLMQNVDNLAFIFSGSRDFAKRERREWALMFNMAQPKEISFLSKEDAIRLITEPVRDYMRYDRKAADRILRLTAGQPFFTQAICLHIIEDLNDKRQNRVTVEYVEEACDDLVENAPYHFAFLWSELAADEKIMVALLAELIPDGMAYASVDDIASRLPYYELEYDRASISKAMARLQEEHLIERKPETEGSYRFRMDLIRALIQAEHPTWGVLKEVQNDE
ncbi:MAG: PEGA domain-containing protein, partial [Bacteroidota bacterium]